MALTQGNAEAGTFANHSGIYAVAKSGNAIAGSVKYGDNAVAWSSSAGGGGGSGSFFNSKGTAACVGGQNVSVASTKMITNTPGQLRLGSGSSNSLVGPDLASMDLRTLTLSNGSRISGLRNGTEAFAVVGSSRAYKNGDEIFVVSSGTGSAGVTGNKVWVNDSQYGDSWAELCDCTTLNRGKMCNCVCHCDQTRRH